MVASVEYGVALGEVVIQVIQLYILVNTNKAERKYTVGTTKDLITKYSLV